MATTRLGLAAIPRKAYSGFNAKPEIVSTASPDSRISFTIRERIPSFTIRETVPSFEVRETLPEFTVREN